jgi:glycosyltransferase involved in cell wall biosynthesis
MTDSRFLFLYPGESRRQRLAALATGEVPRDFFYGYLALAEAGLNADIGDTRRDPAGAVARLALQWEILRNRVLEFGLSRQRVLALTDALGNADVALSFTDAFSLSMGRWGGLLARRPLLAGGFHGLADLHERSPKWARPMVTSRIRQALRGLDHMFFFGEADRLRSIEMYGLSAGKTSLFHFGIDVTFWTPGATPEGEAEPVAFAVGSDPQRDYATLVAAPTAAKLRILTRLDVAAGPGRDVELIRGSFYGSPVTDVVLRDMYRRAAVVVVPVRDVWQPSGYSVTLQAMACGRPVVLTRNRGLWDPHVFETGTNCILVPPGDSSAMAAAIDSLMSNDDLRARIGAAARETAEKQFALARMNRSILALADRLARERRLTQGAVAA